MNFDWDEDKRQATIIKHRIDFVDAAEIFQAGHLILPARSDIEERHIAVGLLNGFCIAVVFTRRDDTIRIITARRARRHEREQYQTLHAGRN